MVSDFGGAWFRWCRLTLVALLLTTTFVTTCFAGPVGVYLALASAIASLIFVFDGQALAAVLRDWGVRCFVLACFMLWFAFVLSARDVNDAMAFVDFLALPVAIPAAALLARYAGAHSVTIVAVVAGIGSAAALATGLFDVHIRGLDRAEGGTSSIFFSDMSALLGFFALFGLLTVRNHARWLFVAFQAFAAGAIVLGGTRGAMLAELTFLAVFCGYALFAWDRPILERLFSVATVLAANALFLVLFFDLSRMLSTFGTVGDVVTLGAATDDAANYRLMFYHAAIQSFLESPIFGHGWWDRFSAALPYMADNGLGAMANDSQAHLHNDVLNFASAAGVIGVLAYLVLMAGPIISAFRSPRSANRGLRLAAAIGLVGGYATMGLTDTMFVFEIPKSMYVLCAAVVMGMFLDAPPLPNPKPR